jgi:hypothetical protein
MKTDNVKEKSYHCLIMNYGSAKGVKVVKPLIHQSELRMKVVPFQEKSSFHFIVLWKLLNGVD